MWQIKVEMKHSQKLKLTDETNVLYEERCGEIKIKEIYD